MPTKKQQVKTVPERVVPSDTARQIIYVVLGAGLAIAAILGFITAEQGEQILDNIVQLAAALGLSLAAANKPKDSTAAELRAVKPDKEIAPKADLEDLENAPVGSILRNPSKPGLTRTKSAAGAWPRDDDPEQEISEHPEDLLSQGWTDLVKRTTHTVPVNPETGGTYP